MFRLVKGKEQPMWYSARREFPYNNWKHKELKELKRTIREDFSEKGVEAFFKSVERPKYCSWCGAEIPERD